MTVHTDEDIIPTMKYQPTHRFNISSEVLSQEVNGETVLLDLEGESYFGLNEVATRIWQLMQSGQCVQGILNTLDDEYDVDHGQMECDLEELLDKLKKAGLVTLVS